MRPSSLSRILAPLALLACVLAVLLTVRATVGSDASPSPAASTQATGTATTKKRSGSSEKRTYTVKAGDSFSVIAEKTGVAVEDLVRLNPGVDPQSLRTGQTLKLRAAS